MPNNTEYHQLVPWLQSNRSDASLYNYFNTAAAVLSLIPADNAWYCSNCKKHQPATKKLDLWKVKKML